MAPQEKGGGGGDSSGRPTSRASNETQRHRRRRLESPLRSVTSRSELFTWEKGRLLLLFPDLLDAADSYYATDERFIDNLGHTAGPWIRTVTIEWKDGRRTEYRLNRLRRNNRTNRRHGLRGILSNAPLGPARTALGHHTHRASPVQQPPSPSGT